MNCVITWPKSRPLESYLQACEAAVQASEVINYRVAARPFRVLPGDRCYVVHDGLIRGYHTVLEVVHREENEVSGVHGERWAAGWYIVRNPHWHPIKPSPMRGFRGIRYLSAMFEKAPKSEERRIDG